MDIAEHHTEATGQRKYTNACINAIKKERKGRAVIEVGQSLNPWIRISPLERNSESFVEPK